MTNADHIRSMTDEELAKWMFITDGCPPVSCNYEFSPGENMLNKFCKKCALDWLKQPYKENENE